MAHLATTYQYIADILSFSVPNTVLEDTLDDAFDWDAVVEVGSSHLVLPAIYCRLKSKALLPKLPAELEDYLEEITAINRNRNKSLMVQIHRLSELLEAHGIDHVFLKGAALLAMQCYEDNAERMVGDIDILIASSQLEKAFNVLLNNGYERGMGYAYQTIGFRHLDRLVSKDALAAVELHGALFNSEHRHDMDNTAVLKGKQKISGIAIPSKTDLAKHQILSYQIIDHGHYYKSLNLKIVYDSMMLKIHTNHRLITSLSHTTYGQSYLSISRLYVKDFLGIPTQKRHHYFNFIHKISTKNKIASVVILSLKRLYHATYKRIRLLYKNKHYRNHIINKIFFK